MRRRPGKAIGYVVAGVLGGLVGALLIKTLDAGHAFAPAVVQPYREVVDSGKPAASGEQVVRVVRGVGPAVISIDTLARAPSRSMFPLFGEGEVREGQGSGFIINGKEGLAVTNNHVVEGAQRIRVNLSDKRSLGAKVVGTDPIGDVALIRIDGGGVLPEVPFGDSDRVEIGQMVVAIGNPLGLQNTVTSGVLSAIGRQLNEGHVRGIPLEDLLQTDAAINPGNSGGPLLDAYGRVIGVNTAIIPQAQGIGFAIAANAVKRSVASILQHGRVIRSWVGITMVDLTPEVARELDIPRGDRKGVAIEGVRTGEPADKAGLRRGDVVTEANGRPVSGGEDLRAVIRGLKPGELLLLRGTRGEKAMDWRVTAGEMPPPEQLQNAP